MKIDPPPLKSRNVYKKKKKTWASSCSNSRWTASSFIVYWLFSTDDDSLSDNLVTHHPTEGRIIFTKVDSEFSLHQEFIDDDTLYCCAWYIWCIRIVVVVCVALGDMYKSSLYSIIYTRWTRIGQHAWLLQSDVVHFN